MPRADKTIKTRKPKTCKIGKTEKEAFEAMSHAPKFPKKLDGIKKHNCNNCNCNN